MGRIRRLTAAGDARGVAAAQTLVAIAALVFVSAVVLRTSSAAFNHTTNNPNSSLAGGDLVLADDDTGSALFTVTDLVPGDSVVQCIQVTYTGSVTASTPGAVKIYSAGYTDSGTFGDWLDLTIEEGTGGSYGSCAGFTSSSTLVNATALSTFDTNNTNYGNGVTAWTPNGSPQSRTYRVTFTLNASTPTAQEGETVTGLGFTWEIQS